MKGSRMKGGFGLNLGGRGLRGKGLKGRDKREEEKGHSSLGKQWGNEEKRWAEGQSCICGEILPGCETVLMDVSYSSLSALLAQSLMEHMESLSD